MNKYTTKQKLDIFLADSSIKNAWGQKPIEIELPPFFELCSEGDLFKALCQYSVCPQNLKKNNYLAEFVTAINNTKTSIPIIDFATKTCDLDLDDYLERVDQTNRNREWSIAYFGLHGASCEVWDNTKQFVDTLSRHIGYRPGGRVDIDCFIGRYSSTPSGIHIDGAHNFGFTFRNGKTMYVWSDSRKDLLWLKSPDYNKFKKDSFPLTNKVGSVCYFPYNAPHVAETKETVSLNINVSLWHSTDEVQQNIDYINSKLKNKVILENLISTSGKTEITPIDRDNISSLKEILEKGILEKQIALNHLLTHTTSGMRVPRPIFHSQKNFNIFDPFKFRDISTLSWYKLQSTDEFLIAANGHCVSCIYDFEIENFLDILTNKRNSFNTFLDFNKTLQEKTKNLMQFLFESGVIETKIL